LTTTESLAVG